MQLINLPNPISLLQLEEEYGDPFYHLVGPYHSLDTSFWWIDHIVTRSVVIDLSVQRMVVQARSSAMDNLVICMLLIFALVVLCDFWIM